MTVRTQVILIVFLLIILGIIINMVKKRDLELKYVLVWLGCDIVLIILTLFPKLMNWMSKILGIYDPMNMIFFLGFVVLILICFSLTVTLSRVTAKVRRIAQVIAMLPEGVQKEILKKLQDDETTNK